MKTSTPEDRLFMTQEALYLRPAKLCSGYWTRVRELLEIVFHAEFFGKQLEVIDNLRV